MKRREARETVFIMLFEQDFQQEVSVDELYAQAVEHYEVEGIAEEPYIKAVYYGVNEALPEIDALIKEASVKWDEKRISRISRAILRLAIYEMKYREDIPVNISANEAVELSKKYDEEKAFTFVNGIIRYVSDLLKQ